MTSAYVECVLCLSDKARFACVPCGHRFDSIWWSDWSDMIDRSDLLILLIWFFIYLFDLLIWFDWLTLFIDLIIWFDLYWSDWFTDLIRLIDLIDMIDSFIWLIWFIWLIDLFYWSDLLIWSIGRIDWFDYWFDCAEPSAPSAPKI